MQKLLTFFFSAKPGRLDGWMTCNFTSFSTVLSGQWGMIMKGCVQWNPVYCWEEFA